LLPNPQRVDNGTESVTFNNMSHRKVIFLLFAVALFFSTIREWNAPSACVRPILSTARAR